MAISSDEEVRLKCLELAQASGGRNVLSRARAYYRFAKGDHPEKPKQSEIPMKVTQEGEAKRLANQIRPN